MGRILKVYPGTPGMRGSTPKVGCENCRKTERNLAQAYLRIERLLAADRNLWLAEEHMNGAQRNVQERRADLRDLRIDTAKWLEGQR